MKLSDYVAIFLAEHGIRHVFAVSGGASVHLIQSEAYELLLRKMANVNLPMIQKESISIP